MAVTMICVQAYGPRRGLTEQGFAWEGRQTVADWRIVHQGARVHNPSKITEIARKSFPSSPIQPEASPLPLKVAPGSPIWALGCFKGQRYGREGMAMRARPW